MLVDSGACRSACLHGSFPWAPGKPAQQSLVSAAGEPLDVKMQKEVNLTLERAEAARRASPRQ
eukprot:109513-Alexandrium_andersonii.AAC.1